MLATALGIGLGLLAPAWGQQADREVTVRYAWQGGEQLEMLAQRYGTTVAAIRAANPGKFSRGRIVQLEATRLPIPVQKLRASARDRDTWEKIAARHGVSAQQIRMWNPRAGKRKRPRSGTQLVLWIPSGAEHYPLPADTSAFPEVPRPQTGKSVGRPHRGRIEDAAKLPPGPYVIRFGWQSFGSALTVWNLQRVIAGFRAETGFRPDIFVGAMSRRSGRRLQPHRSHQSGRDVDVRLPAMPFAEGFKLAADEVDWHAAWALTDAFVRTGDVQVIFLERKLRRRLERAGMALGADDARIANVMRTVRHSPGHTAHIHVRFRCDDDETRCTD